MYWEVRTKCDPRRWSGPQSLPEPESRFFHKQIDSFKPNLIVSLYAPHAVLDCDGPFVAPNRLECLYLDQVGTYPGSLGNYADLYRGVPVVTIELASATKAPLNTENRQMWLNLLH